MKAKDFIFYDTERKCITLYQNGLKSFKIPFSLFCDYVESIKKNIDSIAGDVDVNDIVNLNRVQTATINWKFYEIIKIDVNGAIGILRKANVISNSQLMSMRNRGDIVSPVVSDTLPYKKTKFSKNPTGVSYKVRFGK